MNLTQHRPIFEMLARFATIVMVVVCLILVAVAMERKSSAADPDKAPRSEVLRIAQSDDDLLSVENPETPTSTTDTDEDKSVDSTTKSHAELFMEDRYPSAGTCATCRPKQYREWSVSQHA